MRGGPGAVLAGPHRDREMKGAWITDQGGGDITATLRVTRRLHEERTPYQYLEVYESPLFGRMLVLDGAVQTTEGDEFAYHEMLAHPALCTHPAPRLAPDGLVAVPSGSAGYQQDLIRTVRRHLGAAFPLVRTYLATVAAYPGGLWSFSLGSLGRYPLMADPAAIAKRIGEFGLRYFTASRHHAAFDLPPYLRDEVAAG